MSELVDQIAKLEAKANQLKDSVSNDNHHSCSKFVTTAVRTSFKNVALMSLFRISSLMQLTLTLFFWLIEEILGGPEEV